MAHFAELNELNVVVRVVAIADQDCVDENGLEVESIGIAKCIELFGGGIWKQTSYNTSANEHLNNGVPLRKNYAGIGDLYDYERDAFIAPKPEGDGWVFDEDKCIWRNPEQEAEQAAVNIGVDRV